MANEGHGSYLSDEETVNKIYDYLQQDQIDSATAYFKDLGDDKIVIQAWVNVQCDINNVRHDPKASARIGLAGVDYCLEKGYKLPAAMMLHNVSAFFTPDWDENVDPETILDAARRQVPIRREIPQPGPLTWALWDLGMAELIAGNAVEAIKSFEEGEKRALEQDDRDSAAWCRIFIGKAKVKHISDLKAEGEREMLDAAEVITEIGEDWEKEAIDGILKSVELTR